MDRKTARIKLIVAVTAAALCCLPLAAQASAPAAPRPASASNAPHTFSPLTQITPGNVSKLRGAWMVHLEGGANDRAQEGTPVAVGGNLYVQTAQGDVFALNGATGHVIWEYKSGFPGTERGVAIAGGRVFAAVGGEHVVALNQQTGTLIWQVQVGTPGDDTAANGSPAWNFAGTAGTGQPGNDTWLGDSWKLGGGDAWMAPAYDAKLGLLYLALGNPEPRVS